MTKVSILILAAGNSSRMGSLKQLLPYKNSTLLQVVINNALLSKANKVYCVLGANSDFIKNQIKTEITFIDNHNWEEGMSSSIVTGIKYILSLNAESDGILVVLGDQPHVNAVYINELIECFLENPDYIIASNYGTKKGVPAIFPNHTFKNLLKLKGDKGAQKLLNSSGANVLTIDLKNTSPLADIDTIEDYNQLLGV